MADAPNTLVNHPARVSFTVRRPSPLSSRQSSAGPEGNPSPSGHGFRVPPIPRLNHSSSGANSPLVNEIDGSHDEAYDSSDEDDEAADELVSGFDSMGVQRLRQSAPKAKGPLVIPALANRDWRALARTRQSAKGYVPDGARAAAMTGPDGSQGGLGTRDSINSGPQLSGLVKIERPTPSETTPSDEPAMAAPKDDEPQDTDMELEPLDEDTRALKALLEGTGSKSADEVAAIPMDEATALQRDLVDLPDEATAEGYARVPVEQFGAAMLRGMGWKPPAKGEDEPWVPGQRPALLGLGAKPRAAPEGSEDKSKRPSWMSKQKDRRYVPVVKQERGDGRGSGYSSRASSRSRSPPPFRTSHSDNRATHSSRSDRDREREKDRDRDRERDRQYRNRDDKSDRDRDHRRDRDRDRRGDRDSDRERDRRDRR